MTNDKNEVIPPKADNMKAMTVTKEMAMMLTKGMGAGAKIEAVPSSFGCPECKDVPMFYPEPRAMHHLDPDKPERKFKKLLCLQCGYKDTQEFVADK